MQIAIISLINKVIAAFGRAITLIFAILPESPFRYEVGLNADWVGYMNYVIPVPEILTHMSLYVGAVAIYYVVRIPLRFVKGIE